VQTITRAKFEQMCEPIFNRLIGPCKQAVADATKRRAGS